MRSRLPLRGVEHVRTRLELARVDAEEGQRADVRVGHDLECERRERRVVAGRPLLVLLRCSGSRRSTGGMSSGEGR